MILSVVIHVIVGDPIFPKQMVGVKNKIDGKIDMDFARNICEENL